jgi:hypothetical protein
LYCTRVPPHATSTLPSLQHCCYLP